MASRPLPWWCRLLATVAAARLWSHTSRRPAIRVKEPREPYAAFVYIWAALFGGIPLLMLAVMVVQALGPAVGNGEPSSGGGSADVAWGIVPVLFLLLFPAIAAVALFFTIRRSRRAGFRLEMDGIHGAHGSESIVVPWDEIEQLAWFNVDPHAQMVQNGRPLTGGPALHAVLHNGRRVRIMQRVANTDRRQARMNQQLAAAHAAGLLAVPYGTEVEHGWSGPGGEAMGARREATTLWSSDATLGASLPRQPSAQPDSDKPSWPTS